MEKSTVLVRFTVLISLFTLTSCAALFKRRTFVEEMEKKDKSVFTPGEDFEVVEGDSGNPFRTTKEIGDRTPKTPYMLQKERESNSLLGELKKKEEKLSQKELRRFKQYEGDFENESQKIYYLSLTPKERIEYLKLRGTRLYRRRPASQNFRPTIMHNMYQEDASLYIGMEKNEVRSRWGKPNYVDVAGDPVHQNERWSYVRNGESKQVFFEAGRVQGWYIE